MKTILDDTFEWGEPQDVHTNVKELTEAIDAMIDGDHFAYEVGIIDRATGGAVAFGNSDASEGAFITEAMRQGIARRVFEKAIAESKKLREA